MEPDKKPEGRPTDAEMPPSPITPAGQGASSLHELFLSYVTAGFTRGEALHLVTAQLIEAIRINSQNSDSA